MVRRPRNIERKGFERRQIGEFRKIGRRHELLVEDAHFDFELLLLFDELLQHFRDASGIFTANDHGRLAS